MGFSKPIKHTVLGPPEMHQTLLYKDIPAQLEIPAQHYFTKIVEKLQKFLESNKKKEEGGGGGGVFGCRRGGGGAGRRSAEHGGAA